MKRGLSWPGALVLGCAVGLYGVSLKRLEHTPHKVLSSEMQVALPLAVQVLMAGGDRFLAANVADFRALVASTELMQPDNFVIQGIVQKDAAWLNPAHEDNYYIAAAILPWRNEVDSAQVVLRKAIDGRPFDWQPVFYYAFNEYHFHQKPALAAEWLLKGADRAVDENDRMVLLNVAAQWFEKGYEPGTAARVVDAMAKQAKTGAFRNYILLRADRLRKLTQLQEAIDAYKLKKGVAPRQLSDLLTAGIVKELPEDPFKFGFGLDQDGKPVAFSSAREGVRQ